MAKSRTKPSGGARRKTGHFLTRKDEAVQWFQREGFNPAEFINLLHSEKELDQARHELAQLNEYCKQEVQKVVHAHHKDFLEASRDIQDVEALVDELRNYVSGNAAVVANLVDLPSLPKQLPTTSTVLPLAGMETQPQPQAAWESILALQAELMQDLEVAVSEQDFSLARGLLSAGRDMIAVVDRDTTQLAAQASGDGIPAWRYAFEGALAAQKATLIEELQRQLAQTNSSTLERREAAQNLGLLVGPSQATQALLRCHTLRARASQQHLLKQHSAAGGDPDGVEYAGGLAQRTFLVIGAAAEDVQAVFRSQAAGRMGTVEAAASTVGASTAAGALDVGPAAILPTVSALVVQWAGEESRHCAALLCRHALTPFVATGMAVSALLCIGLALVFCTALETSHGLALRMVFQEELWPLVEAIVRRHLQRLRDEASSAASVDATNAALQAVGGAAAASGAFSTGVGGGGPLPVPSEFVVHGHNQHSGPAGSVQEGLSSFFPRPDLPGIPAAPAGLTSLPMLVPELRALAEGLAPLASVQAVAVLRQGVLAAFASVCDNIHTSLARLVGNAGAGGRDVAVHGPQLAAYVVKAERQLRLFAESDIQTALEPLAGVTGSVAPPDLLFPSLNPLAELLATLPPPGPDIATAASEASSQALLPQQSSGLLDRIRAELEAEQERREREREGWRPRDAHSQVIETDAATPTAVPSTAATVSASLGKEISQLRDVAEKLPSTDTQQQRTKAVEGGTALQGPSRRGPTLPACDTVALPARFAGEARSRDADQPGDATQRRRQRQEDLTAEEGRLGAGRTGPDIAARGEDERSDEAPVRRRRAAQVLEEEEDQDWGQGAVRGRRSDDGAAADAMRDAAMRRHRRAADDRRPGAGHLDGIIGVDEVAAAADPSSRARSRGRGQSHGRGGGGVEGLRNRDEGPSAWDESPPPLPIGGRRARADMTEGAKASAADLSAVPPERGRRPRGLREQPEARDTGEESGVASEDDAAAAHRVQFQRPPKAVPAHAGAASHMDEEPPLGLRKYEDRAGGQVQPLRPPSLLLESKLQGPPAAATKDSPAAGKSPPASRALRGRQQELKQLGGQLERREEEAYAQPPVPRRKGPGPLRSSESADEDGPGEGVVEGAAERKAAGRGRASHVGFRTEEALEAQEGGRQGARRSLPQKVPGESDEEPQASRTASSGPREGRRTAGHSSAALTQAHAEPEAARASGAGRTGPAAVAPSESSLNRGAGTDSKQGGGVGARGPNRFGVVLSDDEDAAAIRAPRLRRPRPADAEALDAAPSAASSGVGVAQATRVGAKASNVDGANDSVRASGSTLAAQAGAAGAGERWRRQPMLQGWGPVQPQDSEADDEAGAKVPLPRRRPQADYRIDASATDERQALRAGRAAVSTTTAAASNSQSRTATGGSRTAAALPGAEDGLREAGNSATAWDSVKPLTARERLAARMAAKAVAGEALL